MKKFLIVTAVLLTAAQAYAHTRYERVCRYHTNRWGEEVRRCRTEAVAHRHHDGYTDGFFDGMVSSSYLVLTTSDIFDGSDKADALESEMTLNLALMAEGIETELSQELREIVEDVKANDETLAESSDSEVLDLILSTKK